MLTPIGDSNTSSAMAQAPNCLKFTPKTAEKLRLPIRLSSESRRQVLNMVERHFGKERRHFDREVMIASNIESVALAGEAGPETIDDAEAEMPDLAMDDSDDEYLGDVPESKESEHDPKRMAAIRRMHVNTGHRPVKYLARALVRRRSTGSCEGGQSTQVRQVS